MIDATKNSLAIIETVHKHNNCSVTAISEETGLAKSTVHSHVETLKRAGYLIESDNEFNLSLRFLQFGLDIRRWQPYMDIIRKKVTDLAERTGERAHYVIREGINGVFVYSDIGEDAVQTGVHTGDFVPLYTTASGKAILANLPSECIDEVLSESELRSITPNTITETKELRKELQNVRSEGLAYNRGEYVQQLWSVGAPVRDNNDRIRGSISISVPAHRVKRRGEENELSTTLLEIINELELAIAHS